MLSNFWMSGSPVWVGAVDLDTRAVRAARFTLDPLPMLRAAIVGGVDDDMFTHLLGDGSLDLLAGGMIGEVVAGLGEILVGDHTAFVSDGLKRVDAVADCNLGIAAAVVPA